MATLYGDETNNILTGVNTEDDSIYGYGGNDAISGLDGNDSLYGDNGDDSLNGGEGNDFLYPGAGINTIDGGNGDDYLDFDDFINSSATENINIDYKTAEKGTVAGGVLDGTTFQNIEGLSITTGKGNDIVNIPASTGIGSGSWNNEIYTYDGNDNITSGSANDYVDAGYGNDTIKTADGNDIIYGGYGKDTINAGAGDDTIYGDYYHYYSPYSTDLKIISAGDGNDYVEINVGHRNTVDGGVGEDRLSISAYGTDTPLEVIFTNATKPITLNGGSFRNIENLAVSGSNDDDIVDVRASSSNAALYYDANSFYGYGGNDKFIGSIFRDYANGGTGNDYLSGGRGNDSLYGEVGTDTLSGGDGDDSLYGGSEDDILTGINTATAIVRPGSGEIDRLYGGAAKDTFVLGDGSRVYYNDGDNTALGQNDFALIGDFSSTQKDIIRLRGTSSDYVIEENTSVSGYYGTGIYLKTAGVNELVAIVQGSNSAANVSAGLSFIAPTTV